MKEKQKINSQKIAEIDSMVNARFEQKRKILIAKYEEE
mgnify:FL=1